MLINLKNHLHWAIYGTGLFLYFYLLVNSSLVLGLICLLFILYLWLLISILLDQYCFKSTLYVFCWSGVLVALSLFFIYGVEQVPLPVGAILFNAEGILLSLLLLFVFSVPLLIYNSHNTINRTTNTQIKEPAVNPIEQETKQEDVLLSEEWEEASLEDLESGSYEPV
ncbi:MAG: hypothetical protein CMG66_01720 [Candidatus Marinimicrobia bacterium]|nr:hypothetical protein [Candidatus Neomarinimicrobiota bacterium]|tara:strand:+ start:13568 stop:14071 length:504 start_codon:yes stop_codon:yes gene_type:complete